jgi:sigma-B regulation protein RsbU (phosphoserine phosphatase)
MCGSARRLVLACICLAAVHGYSATLLLAATGTLATAPLVIGDMSNGSVAINQGWRTVAADDPAFVSAAFDDSAWPVVTLGEAGLEAVGPRWYRLHVRLPAGHAPMGLLVTSEEGASAVYVNGRPAGDLRVRSWLWAHYPHPHAVPLPDDGTDMVIAVRTVESAYAYDVSGSRSSFRNARVGLLPLIQLMAGSDQSRALLRIDSSVAIDLAVCCGALGVLGLYFVQRSTREYLWLSLFLALLGLSDLVFSLQTTGVAPLSWNALFSDPAVFLLLVPQIEFTFAFVRRRVSRAWRWYEGVLLVSTVAGVVCNQLAESNIAGTLYLGFEIAMQTPASLGLPLALLVWFCKGNREAGWLILPSLLPGVVSALFNFSYIGQVYLHTSMGAFVMHALYFQVSMFWFRAQAVTNLLFLLAIGVVLFIRYTRVSRAEARGAAELEAASAVQRRLIPASLPAMDGFRMDAVYLPAAEVGGDFYQVLPRGDGWLIVVGDVSGKGLKAAMAGTLALGALRTLAAQDQAPGALMTRLNQQMFEAGNEGFITCLILSLTASGALTIANAGHLAPYRNGVEVDCDNGLPLGIASGFVYAETHVQLEPGDQLTLLTDGVLEARKPVSGELYGFERTAGLSTSSAGQIARAAQQWGQDDDITVLTLTCVA